MTSSAPEGHRLADLRWIAVLTVAIESVTCLFRFGFGLESRRDTEFLRYLTLGVRVHHGYIGILLFVAGLLLAGGRPARRWSIRVGLSLALSDVVHHVIVLWAATGSPQFDLMYPARSAANGSAAPDLLAGAAPMEIGAARACSGPTRPARWSPRPRGR